MRIVLAWILILACAGARAEELLVAKFNQREPWAAYIVELLNEALARAPGAEPDHLRWAETRMNQDRAFALLRSQELDIYWSMTSAAREQGVIPVRIPLMKGLLGSRLLIIRKDSVGKFAQIKTLDDLKRNVSIGQGLDWPDTTIMTAAGLRVVTSSSYETLFRMLKARRFDGIALGANEIDEELARQHDPDLLIEKNLAVAYPAPVFFFVAPNKKALAERIEKGLHRMMDDGSFNAIFDKRWSKSLIANNLKNRLVFHLPNPLLSPQTADMIRQHPEYFLFPPDRQQGVKK
jgi:ABC-type amino acid transport substrate-binding protein